MRRIQQCLGTKQYMLDLAIVPRLTKGDFGIVFQVSGWRHAVLGSCFR